jgi:hypothetical protein
MVLGDFDTNQFGTISVGYVWVLFILCTLFNMIIMMNLLIAIISESFAVVTSSSEQAAYREMADIISENTYLIPEKEQLAFCPPTGKYLLFATNKQEEVEQAVSFEDQVEIVVEQIADKNREVQKKVRGKLAAIQADCDRVMASKQKELFEIKEKILEKIQEIN